MQKINCTLLGITLLLVGAGRAQANDTVLLGGTGDAALQTLVFDGQADLDQVYLRGWGYRPYLVPRPLAYRPYYRPYAYSYRPYYAYRPYWGYQSYPYAYYAPSYYYPPSYYYGAPAYSYYANPCASDMPIQPQATAIGSSSYYAQNPVAPRYSSPAPLMAAPIDNGTYFYDGGPGQPLPRPPADSPAPTFEQKRPTMPLEGRLVSIPGAPTKVAYPAYGESEPSPLTSQSPVRAAAVRTVPVAYPAYGER